MYSNLTIHIGTCRPKYYSRKKNSEQTNSEEYLLQATYLCTTNDLEARAIDNRVYGRDIWWNLPRFLRYPYLLPKLP